MTPITLITSKTGLSNALQTALEDSEYALTVFDCVHKAITALGDNCPSVIILGQTEQSFFQATQSLHEHPTLSRIPVVLHSDDYSVHNPEYQARLGVRAALNTPVSVSSLLQALQTCCTHPTT